MSVKDDVFEAGGVLIAVLGVFCLMALSVGAAAWCVRWMLRMLTL